VNKIILEKSDFVDEIVVGNLLVWLGPLREAARMGVKQALRSIDAFPRAEDHLLQKTQSGAVGNGFFFLFALLVILESPYVCLNMLTF